MAGRDYSNEELRAALAAADRDMRLPGVSMIMAVVPVSFATSIGLRVANFSDPTHVLILSAAVWLFGWIFLGGSLLQSRQLAANARMLRALELMDERINQRQPGSDD